MYDKKYGYLYDEDGDPLGGEDSDRDEPAFVLRAHDSAGAAAVRHYAQIVSGYGATPEFVQECHPRRTPWRHGRKPTPTRSRPPTSSKRRQPSRLHRCDGRDAVTNSHASPVHPLTTTTSPNASNAQGRVVDSVALPPRTNASGTNTGPTGGDLS